MLFLGVKRFSARASGAFLMGECLDIFHGIEQAEDAEADPRVRD